LIRGDVLDPAVIDPTLRRLRDKGYDLVVGDAH
jgi:hypothetical protein